MLYRSLRQSSLFACFAIVVGFLLAAPAFLSAARTPRDPAQHVYMENTGQTIALPVGEKLVVTLPLQRYDDNTWYVVRNSGAGLKLVAGPDERRPRDWDPFRYRLQVFYFQKQSPGITHLVLEQNYWSKPMILKVVDP
jgi:hypothetical protein